MFLAVWILTEKSRLLSPGYDVNRCVPEFQSLLSYNRLASGRRKAPDRDTDTTHLQTCHERTESDALHGKSALLQFCCSELCESRKNFIRCAAQRIEKNDDFVVCGRVRGLRERHKCTIGVRDIK